MSQTPRDWMLDRERDASPRLDSIRRAVLAGERATFLEIVREIFRPDLPAWTVLVLAWLVLAAAHLAVSPDLRHGPEGSAVHPDLANLNESHDEALSLLDSHS
jgi:hypothetical protein